MKWVKASERLPNKTKSSKQYHCRNIKTGSRKTLWFGVSLNSLLIHEKSQWEWLDEEFESDYSMGWKDAISLVKEQINTIKL